MLATTLWMAVPHTLSLSPFAVGNKNHRAPPGFKAPVSTAAATTSSSRHEASAPVVVQWNTSPNLLKQAIDRLVIEEHELRMAHDRLLIEKHKLRMAHTKKKGELGVAQAYLRAQTEENYPAPSYANTAVAPAPIVDPSHSSPAATGGQAAAGPSRPPATRNEQPVAASGSTNPSKSDASVKTVPGAPLKVDAVSNKSYKDNKRTRGRRRLMSPAHLHRSCLPP